MIFRRLIAFPESRRVFRMHLVATPFLAIQWAIVAMIPVLVRDHFKGSEWETVITTLSIPLMLSLSLLWNELYRRWPMRRYLAILWLVAILPMAGIGWCDSSTSALVFVVLSAAGFGAMMPISGDIMRSCYPPDVRSQAFSYLQMVAQSTVMVGAYGLGVWLNRDAEAFRIYLPGGVLLVGVGMWLLGRISRQPLYIERHQHRPGEPLRAALRHVARNALGVFARDRDFRRYEIAFFLYGLGWMIGTALLPFICVDKLGLNYEQVARSTQTVFTLALRVCFVPVGHLLDRHGPVRTAGWAFGFLLLYPIGLIFVTGVHSLTAVTILFGIGISAVNLAWTIGPITLARDASQAPYYLAIHATMVAVRAVCGQIPAVVLYQVTRRFDIPLMIAAGLFFAGAILMRRLDRDRRRRQGAEPA